MGAVHCIDRSLGGGAPWKRISCVFISMEFQGFTLVWDTSSLLVVAEGCLSQAPILAVTLSEEV